MLQDVSLLQLVTINPQQHLLHQLRLQLCNQRAVATGTITVSARLELESRIALMVQLIPTRLEYLPMWLLQRIQLRLKCCRMYLASTSVTINATSNTCCTNCVRNFATNVCRSNWNDNRDCSDWNWNHYSIDGDLHTNTTGYIYNVAAEEFSYG
jgi:hypothetical protein